ncbi:hypothetical protein BKA82DRAFT_21320 [Pisolithus tinctorius]|uniref:Uncharacterized protein n=1 Tax=Pisolithus tinctorius Marx 270 TaxID=870435 RepID=A0A0C3KLA5_PISTI|nr:hypothetical protein BKA82DRAFT_21320 [Pisolithus tinctorius]KIO10367.1 hypothetical protein M404DRAFT_21320 [Pisolithus tinctorius Marx 270]
MLSNPNNSPPNIGIPADDLACTASVLQLLLGLLQGDTESRNVLLACLGSLMGPLLAPPAPEPQVVSSPVLPVNTLPVDVVQDKLAPATTTALVNHTPAEPTPVTIVIQEPDPSPALDLPTFNTLLDTPSSTSMSTSTIAPSHMPSPLLPGPLDPPSPLTPTVSPNHLVSVPDTAAPADPTTPTHQALNASKPGLDHLPANSPLTGHVSLDHPSTILGSPVSNGMSTVPTGTLNLLNVLQRMAVSPSTHPSPVTVVMLLKPSALEPWGSNAHIVVNFAILVLYTCNNLVQSQAWVQALCMGSTPPVLTPPWYPAKPVIKITQRPARTSKRTHVKSPSPSPPPPLTSGASSSNLAPTPLTSSSSPSLPSLSNAEMLVMLHKALHATTEVLDQASKGHVMSEKVLGKRKLHN